MIVLTITISSGFLVAAIFSILASILCACLFTYHFGWATGYDTGVKIATTIYSGVAITPGKEWVGRDFVIYGIYRREYTYSSPDYIIEAADSFGGTLRIFKITPEEYQSLFNNGSAVIGKEFVYSSKAISPGNDTFFFQRVVGMCVES